MSAEIALQRLADSRLRLRQAMGGDRRDAEQARQDAGRPLPRLSALWRCWRRRLRHSPLADAALSGLQAVWQHHPWRRPAEAAWLQAQGALLPTVRRYPLLTVGVLALGGAAFVASKPWRWGLLRQRLGPRPLGAWLWTQLRLLPLEALVAQWLLMRKPSDSAAPPPR
ncbi:hypothetical protein [Roseateles cavernae]|uniref:hypothetical protein n=1 Tax=Roseateles cavernae TaxID=3153578 RepID=UPI0032E4530B